MASDNDKKAAEACAALGLHPKDWPLGDTHHTEVPPTVEDRKIGDALAYFLGDNFSDVGPDYFYKEMTSVDQWTRIARALRIHGLAITDLK